MEFKEKRRCSRCIHIWNSKKRGGVLGVFIVGMRREDKMRCSRGVHRWIMYKRRRGAVGVFIVGIIKMKEVE